jgi:hypothetical protein
VVRILIRGANYRVKSFADKNGKGELKLIVIINFQAFSCGR